MTTIAHAPLVSRTPSLPLLDSPVKLRPTTKRARSPVPADQAQGQEHAIKRHKSSATTNIPTAPANEKERRKAEKLEKEAVWRAKYLEHFPRWIFVFDPDGFDQDITAMRKKLIRGVQSLGASVVDSLTEEVTHLITDVDPNSAGQGSPSNKENNPSSRTTVPHLLRSPVKLRDGEDIDPEVVNVAAYAISVGKKVWSAAKLASVIERCQGGPLTPSHQPRANAASANTTSAKGNQKSLSQLLEHERLHGTTTERDPNSKRHDYTYFSKNHYFVLVEDLKQELAPIAVLQYPITKGANGTDTGTWPVLHCHPKARGPFIEFDEREEKRWRKAENAEKEREREREQRRKRFEQRRRSLKENQFKTQHDLRRTVSMNNLHRRGILPEVIPDGDPDHPESVNASGYLASGGYVAASGNSVGITSTTGTTSATTDGSLTKLQLPPSLRGRLQQEVVTSRRFGGSGKLKEKGDMGPPAEIPDRRGLRKSRSTNTLRLPKRDEGSKPGYCESCRVRFEDFKEHVQGRKHRKFAADDSHYVELDALLDRVRRRTVEEADTMREGDVVIPAHCEEFGVPDTPTGLDTFEDDGFWDS